MGEEQKKQLEQENSVRNACFYRMKKLKKSYSSEQLCITMSYLVVSLTMVV